MNATQPTAGITSPVRGLVCPVAERASFFFDLELAELTMAIPQAAPAAPVQKY